MLWVKELRVLTGPEIPDPDIGSGCYGALGPDFGSTGNFLTNSLGPDKLSVPRGKVEGVPD